MQDMAGNDARIQAVALGFLAEHMSPDLWIVTSEMLLIFARGHARSPLIRARAIVCIAAAISYATADVEQLIDELTGQIGAINPRGFDF